MGRGCAGSVRPPKARAPPRARFFHFFFVFFFCCCLFSFFCFFQLLLPYYYFFFHCCFFFYFCVFHIFCFFDFYYFYFCQFYCSYFYFCVCATRARWDGRGGHWRVRGPRRRAPRLDGGGAVRGQVRQRRRGRCAAGTAAHVDAVAGRRAGAGLPRRGADVGRGHLRARTPMSFRSARRRRVAASRG